jgi:integrase
MGVRGYGDGRVFRRPDSKWLWIQYWVHGVQYRESTGTQDQKQAEEVLDRRIAEKQAAMAGLLEFRGATRTDLAALFDDLEIDYRIHGRKSASQLHYHLRTVRRLLDGLDAEDMTPHRVRWYIARRQDEGAKNATINLELAAIRRAMTLAYQEGRIKVVPHFPHLREDNVRKGFFERHEVELLVRSLPDYLQDLVRFAWLTGWRRGDILALQWDDVDVEGRVVRLPTSKNGDGRVLALEGELLELIQRRVVERGHSAWVFHREGQPIRSFKEAWKTALQVTGLRGKVFHDFRRTGVRNYMRAGVHERVVMDLTGHKTRSVFDRYNITSEDDLRDAVRRLDQYHNQHGNQHS